MFPNKNRNFNNDIHYYNNINNIPYNFKRFGSNNINNNYFTQNSNQNMNNNFYSSNMNANNKSNLNNINSFMNNNIFNPYMNYFINIPNEFFYYRNNMNNLYPLNNACILNPNYFFLNNNNPFPFKQEAINSPNDDPNYSKILVDLLTNKSDNINDNISDNISDHISDNISKPINLSKSIIHVSPDEKEYKNTDRFYYHLCNFNTINVEEIRAKLEKGNVDSKNIDIILDNMEIKRKENKKFYINDGLFYSNEKMSLYYPHIIKDSIKNIPASLFLPKDNNKLNIYDFQYSNKTEDDDIFMLTLKKISRF